ncbi:hypothetical protein ACFO5U_11385 [Planococcus dechangensis]|uniref:Lantibiotic n=1 Tax=Planococcus dechangensis TaxID=1176255 RepID=A0ABV9MCB9_9BACL
MNELQMEQTLLSTGIVSMQMDSSGGVARSSCMVNQVCQADIPEACGIEKNYVAFLI